jgi:4-hydroxybenzoate polyprenyltransferase
MKVAVYYPLSDQDWPKRSKNQSSNGTVAGHSVAEPVAGHSVAGYIDSDGHIHHGGIFMLSASRRESSEDSGQVDLDALHWGRLSDWAQLVRLPNAFTLVSDTVAASLVVGSFLLPVSAFLPTLIASLCAYWAGMILNDVVDIEEDREFRPSRPLPAGRISPAIAGHVANGLLILGPLLILAVTSFHETQKLWMGAAFLASFLLSLTVRCYNSSLKKTFVGPILMGMCRSLNILMVGSTMFSVSKMETMPMALAWYAAAIGIYIVGVTVYASREESDSQTNVLALGLILEIAGVLLLAMFPMWSTPTRVWQLDPKLAYPLLIVLIGFTVIQRGVVGINHPAPRKVQLAVKHAIPSRLCGQDTGTPVQ